MEKDALFRKYHRRIAKEGILKACFFGLIAGSGALFVTAFFSWFFGFKSGLWLSIGLFCAVSVSTGVLLYFLKFRPTTKQIAVRVDALGLEERLLTMLELEGDESYIAVRQREDAMHAMKSVDSMLIKIVISAALAISLAAALVFGLGGGTTVSALYYSGVIPSGVELMAGEKQYGTFTCTYGVSTGEKTGSVIVWTDAWADGGEASADAASFQVREGDDAPAVYAVPADGYAFLSWSDGVRDPYRKDVGIKGSLTVSAAFVPVSTAVEELEEDRYLGEGSEGQGDGDGDSDSQYDDGSDQSQPQPQPSDPSDPDFPEDLTHSMPNQQIIDGQHYYGNEFNGSYTDAQDRLNSDGNLSDDMKGWINDYYENIGTSGDREEEGGSEGETGEPPAEP